MKESIISENRFLEIRNLSVGFTKKGRKQKVIDNLSFSMNEGEILGIVGESGSGKTITALTIMDLLSSEAEILGGEIFFMGKNILALNEEEKRKLKGAYISMIFQEPMTSLNPLMKIGTQIEEMLKIHTDLNSKEREKYTIDALYEVELENPENLYNKYPHQLSGGMRQRVMIAMAAICHPKLMIADEPTTALDVQVQAQILKLLKRINKEHGTAIMLISHDLSVIKSVCSRGMVFKEGLLIETGSVHDLFYHPEKEYTKQLIGAALPKNLEYEENLDNETGMLETYAVNNCEKVKKDEKELELKNVSVWYEERKNIILGKSIKKYAVKDISFYVKEGEVLGIVGRSGCGKSTISKVITGLIKDYDGEIYIKHNRPQMVFQDPYGSLNPSKKISWILEEPLRLMGKYTKEERKEKVMRMLKQVGLSEKYGDRYPSQLSGGQRQRVCIGAALISNPKLVVLDEPVSALDVTVQAQILELLKELKEVFKLSYIFISHDLSVIEKMCDRVYKM